MIFNLSICFFFLYCPALAWSDFPKATDNQRQPYWAGYSLSDSWVFLERKRRRDLLWLESWKWSNIPSNSQLVLLYASPLFQVEAIKEQVKTWNALVLICFGSNDCGLECAWFQTHAHFQHRRLICLIFLKHVHPGIIGQSAIVLSYFTRIPISLVQINCLGGWFTASLEMDRYSDKS